MTGNAADRTRGGTSPSRLLVRKICWMILLLTTFATPSNSCAQFRFPTLHQQLSIATLEHSTVTLPFELDTSHCPKEGNTSIYIYVLRDPAHKPNGGDFCIVRWMDGVCFAFNQEKCPCTQKKGAVGMKFIKNVSRDDNGKWVWRSGDGNVRAEVVFDIRSSHHDTGDDNDDESKEPTPAPAAKQSTTKPVQPKINKEPLATEDSEKQTDGAKVSNKNKNTGLKSKIHGNRETEQGKMEGVGDKSVEEKSSDDKDEKPVDGSVTTGVIVGMVNVVTIIIVVVIVFVLVRKHSRKTRRHPRDSLPPVSNNVMLPGQRQTLPGDVANRYNTIASTTSSHYEVLPVDRESLVLDKDGYLEPASTGKNDITGSNIELVH